MSSFHVSLSVELQRTMYVVSKWTINNSVVLKNNMMSRGFDPPPMKTKALTLRISPLDQDTFLFVAVTQNGIRTQFRQHVLTLLI
jgi:hypothetical protein